MPYPHESACRISSPAGFEKDSFRRIKQGKLVIIIARPKGSTKTEAQAFRYPNADWSVEEARKHCMEQGGTFEATSSKAFKKYTYNGVSCQATRRQPSSRDDKKYMRTVRYKNQERLVHYGDPKLPMRRDEPDRRANFLKRHSCNEKKDPFAPGFWACYDWYNTKEKSARVRLVLRKN